MMSFRRPLMYALSILSLTSVLAAPQAMAQDQPKGLFFEQLSKPKESINTGLRYWIELVRKGQTMKVTNKHQFTSGDRIRFHVRSNIDGYAYILLSSGSRGEQSVLFPDPKLGEDNRVERGKEYELPAEGFLKFDDNPGTEKVTLLLSRSTMDATAFLNKPSEQPAVIAMAGSKDLVPSKIVIAYNPVPEHKINPPKANPTPTPTKKVEARETESTTVELRSVKSNAKSKSAKLTKKTTQNVVTRENTPPATPAVATTTTNDEGVVTVVKKDPSGVLYIDVSLDHR